MNKNDHRVRILAIDPSSKGFGFAVLEGTDRLVDWGFARVWATSELEFVARVDSILVRYRPRVLVLPEIPSEPRRARSARRVATLSVQMRQYGLRIMIATPSQIRSAFPGTKQERAESIAGYFPELKPWLPRQRRPWMTEDERMDIFDAVALGLVAIRGGANSRVTPMGT
jgi:hypothetical protein